MIPEYIQRLMDELHDLNNKLGSLILFIHENPKFKQLTTEEQHHLVVQEHIMEQYQTILTDRLAAKGYIKHD